jgi:hypothetical protein
MFEVLNPLNIMSKNTKLAGQPVICQVLSFIPRQLVAQAIYLHESDKHYSSMKTYKQMVCMLYGVISKCNSLNSLCKNMMFLEDKLIYLGIDTLPATSTLSDANIKRDSEVFASIYALLIEHYKDKLTDHDCGAMLWNDIKGKKIEIIDSSTISLFVDVFKGAGRNPIDGKKKGGMKIHANLPLGGCVPSLVSLSDAACSDKSYLGQLNPEPGTIYVYDKGYANYVQWAEWSRKEVFFLTRLNDNAVPKVLEGKTTHISEYADGGIISDHIIELGSPGEALKARRIVYKDPESGKVLTFVSNMFAFDAMTIVQLYKYRWNIEVLFKRLKQNFQLGYFFSDSPEGIKTQVWMALIANLIFSVIHKMCKEAEMFTTLVSMAANNMGSYVSLIKIVMARHLDEDERDLKIIQLSIFGLHKGGVLENKEISP